MGAGGRAQVRRNAVAIAVRRYATWPNASQQGCCATVRSVRIEGVRGSNPLSSTGKSLVRLPFEFSSLDVGAIVEPSRRLWAWLGLHAVATAKTASTSITGPTAGTALITRLVPGAGAGWSRSVSTRTASGSGGKSAARRGPRSRTNSSRFTPSWMLACGLPRDTRLRRLQPTGSTKGCRDASPRRSRRTGTRCGRCWRLSGGSR